MGQGMTRFPDWEQRLFTWADSVRREPFVWGEMDCVMLCSRAYDVMTGGETFAQYAGKWNDEPSARAWAVENWTFAEGMRRQGLIEIPQGFAQPGDFFMVERDGMQTGHVCLGSTVLSVDPVHGVYLGRMRSMPPHSVWRIP